jgi:K+/H+ antiporter YhaU regulatory subunit KhtT
MLGNHFLFEDMFKDADRIMNSVVRNTFRTIDDLTETELKAALEKKEKARQLKNNRLEQVQQMLYKMFRQEVHFEITDLDTPSFALVNFKLPTGENGSAKIFLANTKFF